jgi:hypothetical protein
MSIQPITSLGDRAKEPISDCLARRLVVPYIYWNAEWPTSGRCVDLLLIDRAGTGQVHVVDVKQGVIDVQRAVQQVMACPADYRWLALVAPTETQIDELRQARELEFSGGPGRIGLLVVRPGEEESYRAEVVRKAEKFAGSLRKEAAEFVAAHEPDIKFD